MSRTASRANPYSPGHASISFVQGMIRALPGPGCGRAARRPSWHHQGQLLLALPQPGRAGGRRPRPVGAAVHDRSDRQDGSRTRSGHTTAQPVLDRDRRGRTGPDRGRPARQCRSPGGRAGTGTRHRPPGRLHRGSVRPARVLPAGGQAAGCPGVQCVPRVRRNSCGPFPRCCPPIPTPTDAWSIGSWPGEDVDRMRERTRSGRWLCRPGEGTETSHRVNDVASVRRFTRDRVAD